MFTLLAWGFAHLDTVCQALVPGSFVGAVDPAGDRSWMELLFLSFTTLSGVLFIALVVSRLIGMTFGARRHKEQAHD